MAVRCLRAGLGTNCAPPHPRDFPPNCRIGVGIETRTSVSRCNVTQCLKTDSFRLSCIPSLAVHESGRVGGSRPYRRLPHIAALPPNRRLDMKHRGLPLKPRGHILHVHNVMFLPNAPAWRLVLDIRSGLHKAGRRQRRCEGFSDPRWVAGEFHADTADSFSVRCPPPPAAWPIALDAQ